MDWTLQEPALVELLAAFRQDYAPVYVVGGAVRDLLLGRQPRHNDLDLVVTHDALSSARRVADRLGWAYYPMDEARDVARLVFAANSSNPIICDVAGMRGGSIEADLLTRDFTINAMALAFPRHGEPELIDICGGRADLQRRLVRRVTAFSLAEDAVRILRAVRLANQLDFQIEGATQTQLQRLAHTLRLVSPERIRDELWKLLTGPEPARGIETAQALGVLAQVLPEVSATAGVTQSYPHYQDVFNHTLATVRHAVTLLRWVAGESIGDQPALAALERALGRFRFQLRRHVKAPTAAGRTYGEWLVFHALLHDIGKPATRSEEPELVQPASGTAPAMRIRFLDHEKVGAELASARLSAMRFSRFESTLAETVVAAHMRPHHLHASFEGEPVSRRAIYRFFRDTGGRQAGPAAGIATILLALADYQAIYPASPPPGWSAYLDHMADLLAFAYASPGESPLPKPLLDGHDLMKHLHLKPGRQVGELLERLREAQAAGEVSTPAEALHLAAGWLNRQRD